MSAPSGVTVAVVTWNSEAVIDGFLESLHAATAGLDRWEVVVADNCSADGTATAAESAGDHVRVVRRTSNDGYAAGLNDAVAHRTLRGPIVVANPDTRPAPGSVRTLVELFASDHIGIAVPRLVAPDGELLHSQRREPTVLRALGEAVLGGSRAGRIDPLGEVVTADGRYQHPGPVDWATGAFMAISEECWNSVGPWDDSFFLYSEETEYCLRARDAGFTVWFQPAAEVVHVGGESRSAPLLYALVAVNKVRLFRRRNGRASTIAFHAACILSEVLRLPAGETHRTALTALLGRLDPARELRP